MRRSRPLHQDEGCSVYNLTERTERQKGLFIGRRALLEFIGSNSSGQLLRYHAAFAAVNGFLSCSGLYFRKRRSVNRATGLSTRVFET